MNPKRLIPFIAGILLTVGVWFAPALATASSQYELTDGSGYIEGCFDPCMCPIFMNLTLEGSFQLVTVFQDVDDGLFEVEAVDWRFQQWGESVSVTGSGIYEIDAGEHRLELDLVVGDEEERHFDSGWVATEVDLPAISIAAAVNGFFCYDYVFVVEAVPTTVDGSRSTWGGVKAVYR